VDSRVVMGVDFRGALVEEVEIYAVQWTQLAEAHLPDSAAWRFAWRLGQQEAESASPRNTSRPQARSGACGGTAIPAAPSSPVITGSTALAFRKHQCENTPLTCTLRCSREGVSHVQCGSQSTQASLG